MRIAITVATGTLGTALVHALLGRGDQVVVLSRTPHALRRLQGLVVDAYSYDDNGLRAAMAAGPIDALVHAACAYGRSGESPADLMEANLLHPMRLVDVAGTTIGQWIAIGTALPRTVSFYALSKAQFAEWLELLPASQIGPRAVIALENFYGPGEDPGKFLTRVVRACISGQPLDLTVGTQKRDFIHIDDVINALIRIIDQPEPAYRVIPVGSGTALPVRQVVERIHAAAASRSELRFGTVPLRPNEPECCVADTTYLRRLGWTPTVSLDQGLYDLVASEAKNMKNP